MGEWPGDQFSYLKEEYLLGAFGFLHVETEGRRLIHLNGPFFGADSRTRLMI